MTIPQLHSKLRNLARLTTAITLTATAGGQALRPMSWEKPVAPGVVYREEVDPEARRSIHALRISMKSPSVHLTTELYGRTSYESPDKTGRGPLSKIVADHQALAGVNADFFSMLSEPTGDPLGITVREGRLLSTPSKRVAFGWGPDTVEVGTASFSGTVQSGSTVLRIDGINRKCQNNEITLDTPDAGLALAKAPSIAVVVKLNGPVWSPSTVLRGTVASIAADETSLPVESERAVLEARGAKCDSLAALRPGAPVTLVLKTTGFDWDRVDTVVGGGPRLLRDGKVDIDAREEGFTPDFSDKRHPRTAIGRTAVGDIWLVAVDGRQETGDGLTLTELAQTMLGFGCVDAINLDGGGSTTMNVLGVTINRPSDGAERSIADAILVLGRQPKAIDADLRLWLPSQMVVGSETKAWVRGASEDLPNREIIWGCTGAAAIDQSGNLRALHTGQATVSAWAGGKVLAGSFKVTPASPG